ncbi:AAA family ATPase [Streptacidiphilus cavernicola]|uniref:AAA family ATPase n=1 Tax=Streptacidiphilus cavernicola TaxID=3342716 RepID=A0ABV6W2F5_9ACTN
MERVLVAGSTGAGKTTLARALAGRLGIPFHEMDALAITGPGWQDNPRLFEDVSRISAEQSWIFDSLGYPEVRDLLWSRADTVVWLDYSRPVVMRRVLRRSAARTLLRRRVFGGNVETAGSWFSADHPARWAWSQYANRRAEIAARSADPRFAPLDVVHLGTPRAAQAWQRTVIDPAADLRDNSDRRTAR